MKKIYRQIIFFYAIFHIIASIIAGVIFNNPEIILFSVLTLFLSYMIGYLLSLFYDDLVA